MTRKEKIDDVIAKLDRLQREIDAFDREVREFHARVVARLEDKISKPGFPRTKVHNGVQFDAAMLRVLASMGTDSALFALAVALEEPTYLHEGDDYIAPDGAQKGGE